VDWPTASGERDGAAAAGKTLRKDSSAVVSRGWDGAYRLLQGSEIPLLLPNRPGSLQMRHTLVSQPTLPADLVPDDFCEAGFERRSDPEERERRETARKGSRRRAEERAGWVGAGFATTVITVQPRKSSVACHFATHSPGGWVRLLTPSREESLNPGGAFSARLLSVACQEEAIRIYASKTTQLN